jgi:hypothetical protein
VGHVTKFSDTLLIYRMQTLRRQRPPEPDNPHEVVLPHGGGAVQLDEETLARIRREIYNLPDAEGEC